MSTEVDTFQADVSSEDQTSTIILQGEINGLADDAMTAAYQLTEAAAPNRIILDFSQVDYINSTGIALIVGLLARARTAQIPLEARGLSDHYREIFTITRLSDFIEIK